MYPESAKTLAEVFDKEEVWTENRNKLAEQVTYTIPDEILLELQLELGYKLLRVVVLIMLILALLISLLIRKSNQALMYLNL